MGNRRFTIIWCRFWDIDRHIVNLLIGFSCAIGNWIWIIEVKEMQILHCRWIHFEGFNTLSNGGAYWPAMMHSQFWRKQCARSVHLSCLHIEHPSIPHVLLLLMHLVEFIWELGMHSICEGGAYCPHCKSPLASTGRKWTQHMAASCLFNKIYSGARLVLLFSE